MVLDAEPSDICVSSAIVNDCRCDEEWSVSSIGVFLMASQDWPYERHRFLVCSGSSKRLSLTWVDRLLRLALKSSR